MWGPFFSTILISLEFSLLALIAICSPNTVYINPLNSLRFVLNELKKDKVSLDKNFYVFTGSTVGVVPILGKGLYTGKVAQLGSVKAIIH